MDDLGQQLQEIFHDPEKMQQVMQLASTLGLEPPAEEAEDHAPRSSRQDALVEALLPYLRPARRERLRRALQVARLTDLGRLLQQAGWMDRPKEEEHV